MADFKSIPKEIGKLTNLEKIEIDCENLEELPKEISNLNKLENLKIYKEN